MYTNKLSDEIVRCVQVGGPRLSDGAGLYLKAARTDREAHVWRFDYSFGGKRKTLSLGSHPAVSLVDARERAQQLRDELAEGNNPPDLRKQRRAGLAGGTAQRCADPPHLVEGSFEEIARRWFVLRKDDWIETYSTKVLRRLERHVFPYIGEVVKLVAVPHAVPNHLVAQESLQGFKHLVRGLGSVAEHGHLDLGRA